jgi:hypothetical protein
MNYVLAWLRKEQVPLTVENYCSLNWGKAFNELEGENSVEVEDLIESGELKVVTPGSEMKQ